MPYISNRPVRFLFSGINDGYINMAMDEAVIEGLRVGSSIPILRIYRWNPPTISIGYFQKASDINIEKCRKERIGVVRRLTGGRAVLHDEELTYSILFTVEDFTPFTKKEIFSYIAQCLTASLEQLGIISRIAERSRGDLRSADCFASPAQFEVETLESHKLIGSAQVIKNGVVLQHGSIPLTTAYSRISNYFTNQSTSVKKASALNMISNSKISYQTLFKALRKGFSRHFPLIDGKLTDEENQLTEILARNKYSQDSWMFRR